LGEGQPETITFEDRDFDLVCLFDALHETFILASIRPDLLRPLAKDAARVS
jgi:hypothetical protein